MTPKRRVARTAGQLTVGAGIAGIIIDRANLTLSPLETTYFTAVVSWVTCVVHNFLNSKGILTLGEDKS